MHALHPSWFALALAVAAPSGARGQCSQPVQRLMAQQKWADARAEVAKLLERNQADDVALHCMGRIDAAQGRSGDAVRWLEKAIAANDKSAHHEYLGELLGGEAQHANKLRQPFLARRVKAEFSRAVALDSTNIDAHDGLMQFYLQAPGIMGGSVDKARDEAKVIARLNAYEGHLAAADVAAHDGDAGAEEQEWKAALQLAPDSIRASYSLGGFYEKAQKWTEAFALYDRLITEKPQELGGRYRYGRAAAVSGQNLERGERELKYWLANATSSEPLVAQSGAHWRLGMIYERQGKRDAARSEYQAAVAINPQSEDAKRALAGMK